MGPFWSIFVDVDVEDTIFRMSPTRESCNWIDFISVANASWYHWKCGRTQHKAATINQRACPSYSFYVQLLGYPMYYPGGMKARVSPVQRSKPYSMLAPTQDSIPCGRFHNHMRWPLHYHCTLVRALSSCGPCGPIVTPMESRLSRNVASIDRRPVLTDEKPS